MANRSDNFTRADNASALGTPSDGGSAWVNVINFMGISTNRAYNASSTTDVSVLDAGALVVDVSCVPTGTMHTQGLSARVADSLNYVFVRYGPPGLFVSKVIAGSSTQIGFDTGAVVSAGDTLTMQVRGTSPTTFTILVNGVANSTIGTLSVSDASIQTSTRYGLYCQGSLANFWTSFGISDLTPQVVPVLSGLDTRFTPRQFTY